MKMNSRFKINHAILKTYTDNNLSNTMYYNEMVTHLFRGFIGLSSTHITEDGINFLIDVGVLEYDEKKKQT